MDRALRIAAVMILLCCCVLAHAKLSGSYSHAIASDTGDYLLVFIGRGDRGQIEWMLPDGTTVVLGEVFGTSGLYELSSRRLMWNAPGYFRSSEVFSSGDLSRIVLFNEDAYGNGSAIADDTLAVAIYTRAEGQRIYTAREILPDAISRDTGWSNDNYHADWYGDVMIIGDSLEFTVPPRTVYLFDQAFIASVGGTFSLSLVGPRLVRQIGSRTNRIMLLAIAVLGGLLIAALAWLARLRSIRMRRACA